MRVRASFSPVILQAGTVKGFKTRLLTKTCIGPVRTHDVLVMTPAPYVLVMTLPRTYVLMMAPDPYVLMLLLRSIGTYDDAALHVLMMKSVPYVLTHAGLARGL